MPFLLLLLLIVLGPVGFIAAVIAIGMVLAVLIGGFLVGFLPVLALGWLCEGSTVSDSPGWVTVAFICGVVCAILAYRAYVKNEVK